MFSRQWRSRCAGYGGLCWLLATSVNMLPFAGDQVALCRADSLEQRLAQWDHSSTFARFWRQKRAYPLVDQAQRLLAQGLQEQARQVYDSYLAVDPDNLQIAWSRLQLVVQTGPAEEVVKTADDLLRRAPDLGPLYVIRGQARLKAGDKAGAREDFFTALADPQLAAEDRRDVQGNLVSLLLDQGALDQAAQLCRELIETAPDVPEHRLVYADILSRQGELQAALRQWQIAAEKTRDPRLLRNLTLVRATSLIAAGDTKACLRIVAAKKTDALFADAPLAQRQRLFVLRAHSAASVDRRQAIHSVRQARTELNTHAAGLQASDRAALLLQLGDSAFALQQYAWAFDVYQQVLAIRPDPQLRRKAAQAAWYARQYDQVELLLKVLPAAPDTAGAQETDLLLCAAYEQQGKTTATLDCLEQAMRRYPHAQNIPAKAAHVAHSAGMSEREAAFLVRCFQLQPSASRALDIGHLYLATGQRDLAGQWFAKAHELAPSVKTAEVVAQHLYVQGRYAEVIALAVRFRQDFNGAPSKDGGLLVLEAQARMQTRQYAEAAKVWAELEDVASFPLPQAILGRMEALYRSGAFEQALAVAARFPATSSEQERLACLSMRAAVEQALGRDLEALSSLQEAAALSPSTERLLSLSMLAQKTGQGALAEQSARQVLQLQPAHSLAKKQLAFVLAAQGNNKEAAPLLAALQTDNPADYRVSRALGYALQQLGSNEEALAAYDRALLFAQLAVDPVKPEGELLQEIKDMQNQAAELDRGLSYTLGLGLNLDGNEQQQGGWDLDKNTSSQAYGIGELAFRPGSFGYRNGKSNELYGRLIWTENGSITDEDDSPYQGSLGARIKPFAESNLVLTTEALFSLANTRYNDLFFRVSHSYSRTPWQRFHRDDVLHHDNDYRMTYAEIGTSLTGTTDVVYSGQGRYGTSLALRPDFFLSPFLYGSISGYEKESGTETDVEGGVGVAVNVFSAYDQTRGYRREAELAVRLGMEWTEEETSDSFRGFLGFRLTGF